MKLFHVTVTALVLAAAGAVFAASPAQVGTWKGTAKVTTFTGGANKSVSKQDMQIEIAADDTTTITVAGAVQTMDPPIYNATDCFVAFSPNGGDTAYIATFSFKNNAMKGTSIGLTGLGGALVSTAEAKYKLKKQQ